MALHEVRPRNVALREVSSPTVSVNGAVRWASRALLEVNVPVREVSTRSVAMRDVSTRNALCTSPTVSVY